MSRGDAMSGGVKTFVKCERGTQMIEFALLLPFLIILFASSVEMGRMFYTYTTLQKSTQVAARYLSTKLVTAGAYSSTDIDKAKSLVVCGRELASCSGQTTIVNNLAAANVTVTSPGTAIGTRYVTDSVTYAYTPKIWDLGHMTGIAQLSLNFTFTPSEKMRYMF